MSDQRAGDDRFWLHADRALNAVIGGLWLAVLVGGCIGLPLGLVIEAIRGEIG